MDAPVASGLDGMETLDRLFAADSDRWTAEASAWWDDFYADRSRPIPFFTTKPDESLISYVERGLLGGPAPAGSAAAPRRARTPSRSRTPGRALDLGCGPGRNALYLASLGFEVDAVDLSPAAVGWARQRAAETAADVRFIVGDAFTADLAPHGYDLVYDSGCLHHLPPHRRVSYLDLLDRVLAPGGHLAVACFAAGAMGSELPDEDFYRDGRLHGGLAYTPESLRFIFSDLAEIEIRMMEEQPPDGPCFGVPFLLAALFSRRAVG
ncbi:class I SAM-dependent methyltransferase [Nonomuraea sp. SMC257]|uniref:Class I SAM-dependent methyltransferase n=2 Tax=Nonomuraea montanisoli TaxID=2741721 RepID=A0A7Y6IAI4_9ACTN|nr:class I SAM-dependent methyltransferase [Nonomuraea montanisoli]